VPGHLATTPLLFIVPSIQSFSEIIGSIQLFDRLMFRLAQIAVSFALDENGK